LSYIQENLQVAKLHLDRLKKAKQEIEEKNILENFDIENFDVVKVVDTFIYRFIKLQDYIGNKLFRTFLNEIGEYRDYISLIDVLDKLEKLKIINSTQDWINLRKLKNKLTHEYPNELEEIKEELKISIEYIPFIEETINKIEGYLKEKNLIGGDK
jgi:hypothetical protein